MSQIKVFSILLEMSLSIEKIIQAERPDIEEASMADIAKLQEALEVINRMETPVPVKKASKKTVYELVEGDRIAIDDDREIVTVSEVYPEGRIRYYDEDGVQFITTIDDLLIRNVEIL